MKSYLLVICRFSLPLFFAGTLSAGLGAQTLPKPKGPVILTVAGQISQRNAGDNAEFDAEMLDALPVAQFSTTSPWHAIPVIYAGPSLKSVLNAVGAQGKVLRMIAMNKYETTVPFDDAAEFGPVLARRADGNELMVRSKGPLLMIYPFDSKPKLKSDIYYSRSIWQLQKIVVE